MSTARSRACREPPVTVTIIVTVTFTVPIAVSFTVTVNLIDDRPTLHTVMVTATITGRERERERDKSGAGSKWKSFDCAHGHGMHSSPNAVRAKGAREATSPLLPASLRRLVSNPPPWLARVREKILRCLPERSGRLGNNHPPVSRALGAPGKQPLPLASRAL